MTEVTPIPWPKRLRPECPNCGSFFLALAQVGDRKLAGCANCHIAFEPLPTDAPPDVQSNPQPFRKACDNCAFHQNSPERSDPEKWHELEMEFAYRKTPFYCHKGVPVQVEGEEWPLNHGFKYPVTEAGDPDISRLRLCAGFIAWWRSMSDEPVPGFGR